MSADAEAVVRALLDGAVDGALTVAEDGRIEFCNKAAAEMLGWRGDALLGRPFADVVPAAAGPGVRAAAAGAREGGLGTGTFEVQARRRDGSGFPLELSISESRIGGQRRFLVFLRDATRRRLTEETLREAEERLGDLAGNLPVVVFQRVQAADGRFYLPFVSRSVEALLGIPVDEAMAASETVMGVVHAEDRARLLAANRRSAENLTPLDEEYRVVARGGETKWLREVARPRALSTGEIIWDGVAIDVTRQKRAEEHLHYLAYHDPLTGVLNRAAFIERFARVLGAPAGERTLAVLTVSLDRVAEINDTLGHAAGDDILKAAAKRIAGCLAEGDLLARHSSGAFAALVARRDDAGVVAAVDGILDRFRAPFDVKGRSLDLTASVGVSFHPKDGEDAETLLKNADTALRRARQSGAGGHQFFSEEMNVRVLKVMVLENRLRRAVKADEFVVYYQPQVDLLNGAIVGMEALVRWLHPRLGLIPPSEFIPVAEDAGLIGDIAEKVLRDACWQNKAWQREGHRPVAVAVNISARQFAQPDRLLAHVQAALDESGLDPAYLEVELTESAVMTEPDSAAALLGRLNRVGVATAIDDFGTGYSSLGYLKRFPIGKLKVDRTFILDVTNTPNDAAIVRAIIAMARALRLMVVAEGVETREQLDFLRKQGCDCIQGYLFSQPVTAADMGRLLAADVRLPLSD